MYAAKSGMINESGHRKPKGDVTRYVLWSKDVVPLLPDGFATTVRGTEFGVGGWLGKRKFTAPCEGGGAAVHGYRGAPRWLCMMLDKFPEAAVKVCHELQKSENGAKLVEEALDLPYNLVRRCSSAMKTEEFAALAKADTGPKMRDKFVPPLEDTRQTRRTGGYSGSSPDEYGMPKRKYTRKTWDSKNKEYAKNSLGIGEKRWTRRKKSETFSTSSIDTSDSEFAAAKAAGIRRKRFRGAAKSSASSGSSSDGESEGGTSTSAARSSEDSEEERGDDGVDPVRLALSDYDYDSDLSEFMVPSEAEGEDEVALPRGRSISSSTASAGGAPPGVDEELQEPPPPDFELGTPGRKAELLLRKHVLKEGAFTWDTLEESDVTSAQIDRILDLVQKGYSWNDPVYAAARKDAAAFVARCRANSFRPQFLSSNNDSGVVGDSEENNFPSASASARTTSRDPILILSDQEFPEHTSVCGAGFLPNGALSQRKYAELASELESSSTKAAIAKNGADAKARHYEQGGASLGGLVCVQQSGEENDCAGGVRMTNEMARKFYEIDTEGRRWTKAG